MRIYILLLLFGISHAFDNTPYEDLYIELDPSDKSFDWKDTYCPPGYFRIIDKVGTENCLLCRLSFFRERYTQTNLNTSTVPIKYRHGKCCLNSHHRVCEKLKESFLRCTEECPKCPHDGLPPTKIDNPIIYLLPTVDEVVDSEIQNQTSITNTTN
jgi:hypothetical protein